MFILFFSKDDRLSKMSHIVTEAMDIHSPVVISVVISTARVQIRELFFCQGREVISMKRESGTVLRAQADLYGKHVFTVQG